jgi:hypothetical protein
MPWLNHTFDPAEVDDSIGYVYDKTGSATHVSAITNGTIRVQVLTTLSSPQAAPSCHIIAYVRGGENLEVAFPVDSVRLSKATTHLDLQGGVEDLSDVSTGDLYKHRYLVNFGEQVCSLRQLLSRSSVSQIFTPQMGLTSSSDLDYMIIRHTKFPVPPGYNTGAYLYSESILTPESNERFCFSQMHPINWVSACYAAQRGAVQVHYSFSGAKIDRCARLSRILGSIDANDDKTIGEFNVGVDDGTTQQISAETLHGLRLAPGTAGQTITHMGNCPVMSAELTDQHQYMFNVTRQENWLRGTSADDTSEVVYQFEMDTYAGSDINKTLTATKHMNIAPDFNLHFFVCTPTVYYSGLLGQAKYEE